MGKIAKKLQRSEGNSIIAGVCGGLAKHFNIDPVFVRAGFVLFALADGFGVLTYAVFWVMMPKVSPVVE